MMKIRSGVLVSAGVAAGIAFVVSCGSGPGNILADMGIGGSCGSCNVTGPVELTGPVEVKGTVNVAAPAPLKVITADTDVNQLIGGFFSAVTSSVVAQGPFVLTDVVPEFGSSAMLAVATGSACPPAGAVHFIQVTNGSTNGNPFHGARIVISAGSVLCATTSGNSDMAWAGFKPY